MQKEDDLEKGRFYAGFVAVSQVALEVPQEVLVKAVVEILGLGPDMEDKILRARLVCPKSVPA